MNRAMPLTLSGSSRLGLLVAGGLAIITGILVFAALRGSGGDPPAITSAAGGPTQLVITARQDIAPRTVITPDMLQVTEVPAAAVLGGGFTQRELVAGQVASVPILKGEQVVGGKLASSQSPIGLPYLVPQGYRAMGVKVDKVIGAGGLIRPGDRVDVIGVVDVRFESLDATNSRELRQTSSIVLAQNVPVLAVEQELENRVPVAGADGQAARQQALVEQPKAQPEATVVTIAITAQEAQDIMLAEVKGTIRFLVRAPGDDGAGTLENRTFGDLLDPATRARFEKALGSATQ